MEVHGALVVKDTFIIAYFSKAFRCVDVLLMFFLIVVVVFVFVVVFNTDGDADACSKITINGKYIFEYTFASYVIFYGFKRLSQ